MKLSVRVSEPRLAPLRPSRDSRPPDPSSETAGGGAVVARPLALVTLEASDGIVGRGEAAPLADYDGVSMDAVLAALELYAPLLARDDVTEHAEILESCAALDPLPQALAAVDLALWDLAGQRAGQPVWALLGVEDPEPIRVNATIGSVAPCEAAQEARAAAAAGFTCIKVKVGTPDDRQRLEAVREAVGDEMLIRVDANGAWTQLDAPERIRALSRFDIELFEEPVHGLAAARAVARHVPQAVLALDESAGAVGDPEAPRACNAVCLKIAASGGISGVLRDAGAARAIGYEVYLASTLDGPLGIAAALHAAAVVKPDRHCGLATLGRFEPAVPAGLVAESGLMRVPAGPGLGHGLLDCHGLLDWYLR